MGRPSKLNPAVHAKLVDAIRVGATYELASQYAGIDYKTFRTWMKKGEAANSGKYRQLFQDINEAEGQAGMKWLALIDKAAISSWQAAAWKLERRYPEAYGRTVQDTRHSGKTEIVIKWPDGDD